ncbi:MAG: serine hydrolase [Bacteroidota bacterium]
MPYQKCRQEAVPKIFFVILMLFGCGSLFAQQKNSIEGIKQLTDSIRAIVNREHIPGLMVGITNKDSVLFSGGFGYADMEAKRFADGTTLFRMGSITKMFVSLSVLKLIQEGKLGLNDELKKVAPEIPFKNEWEATHPVRIVHLLEHTAGFDDMKLNRMCSQDKKEYSAKEMMLLQQHSLVCRWKPGERYAYSNPGFVILGYVIEKITGKSYSEYIAENIFQPLGMTHSNFNAFSKFPQADTKQYVVHSGKIIEVPSVNVIMAPAGSLWSCSDDMLKFLQLFLANGKLVFPDSIINEMETTHSSLAAKSGLKSGYALANYSMFLFEKSPSWRGHGGLMGTCFSTFAYNRELGSGFVLSSNGNQQNQQIERLIADYLEQKMPEKKQDTVSTDLKFISAFAGQYQFANPRNQISGLKDKLMNKVELYIENNAVFVKTLSGDKMKLLQTSPSKFAHEGANNATIIFTKNEEGKNVMIMDGAYYEQGSFFKVRFMFWVDVVAIFFALSAVVTGIISFIGLLAGRVKRDKLVLMLLPMSGVLLLVWAVVSLLQVQNESYLLSELVKPDARTLTVFLGTSLFGLFAVLHIIIVLRNYGKIRNKFFAVYWMLASLSIFYIAFILFLNGWIGLRTWAM